MPYDKETRERFRRIMKHTILPEAFLPSMTKNIRPHNFIFMPRRKNSLHSHGWSSFPKRATSVRWEISRKTIRWTVWKKATRHISRTWLLKLWAMRNNSKPLLTNSFPTCMSRLKPDSKPVQGHMERHRRNWLTKEIKDVVHKLAGLFMEEMINALMTA